jgi:hypothetical protein
MAETKIVNKILRQRNECREERKDRDCREERKDRDCPVCEVGEGKRGKPFWPRYPNNAATAPVVRTIYASTGGSDKHGDGAANRPYATLVRAVRDVPPELPQGVFYRIDITGITEELPSDFALPEWKTWINDGAPLPNQTLTDFQPAVEIFATPQPVAAIPLSDTIINASDVASVVADLITGLQTINLITPRASWTAANILGKQVLVGPTDPEAVINNSVVGQVFSTSSIQITNTASPVYPLSLVEPSAHLHGSGTDYGTIIAANIDNVGFTGVKITSDNGFNGLVAFGSGSCVCQLCELDSPFMVQQSGNQFELQANRVLRSWVYNFPTYGGVIGVVQSLHLNAQPVTNFDSPFFCAPTTVSIRRSVFTACDSIEVDVYEPGGNIDPAGSPHVLIQNTLVQGNPNGDGAAFHGVKGHFTNADFSSNTGNGITVDDGGGLLTLENVGSSTPNGVFGLQISDGMQVTADAATVGNATPLSGATNQVEVGNLAAQTWVSVGAVFAASPNNSINDFAGVTATGARLGQS